MPRKPSDLLDAEREPEKPGLRDIDSFVAKADFVPPIGGEFRVVSAESFNLDQPPRVAREVDPSSNELRELVTEIADEWAKETPDMAKARDATYHAIAESAASGFDRLSQFLKDRLSV